jgi:hypothetical protein
VGRTTSRRSEVRSPIKLFSLKVDLEDHDSSKLKSISRLLPGSRLVSDVVLSLEMDTENPEKAIDLLKQTRDVVKTAYGPDRPGLHAPQKDLNKERRGR